jgi:hypothetical protein
MRKKNPAAVMLGRKGGRARAKALKPARRCEIALLGARASGEEEEGAMMETQDERVEWVVSHVMWKIRLAFFRPLFEAQNFSAVRSAEIPGRVIHPTSRTGVIRIGTENFSAHSAAAHRRGRWAYFSTNAGIVPRTLGSFTKLARPSSNTTSYP